MHQSPLEARFFSKINKEGPLPEQCPELGPCWLWTACIIKDRGYGLFVGNDGKLVMAHRFCWEILRGPIPEGMNLCHHCDVRNCCNPDHCFIGTQSDNIKDAFQKGRLAKIHGHGEGNGFHKLTANQVIQIRELAATGMPQPDIAKMFNISRSAVSLIHSRLRWSHI